MKRLQFGMVGGGHGSFIGDVHRRGAQMDECASLVAGCFSRSADKNKRTAEAWHLAPDRVYESYQQMAEAESARADGIDFVAIATPNSTHYEIAKCFLEHGIHVSCDKPVTLNLAEAEELARIAKARGLHFGVSYTYVNYPLVHQMRAMIAEGKIGNIVNVVAEYPQDWVIACLDRGDDVRKGWRFTPAEAGQSACTADIGTHATCLMEAATGLKISRVLANLSRIPADLPLDTNTQVLMTLDGGIPAMLWASQVAVGYECGISIRIFGDKGSLEWSHTSPQRLKYTPINAPEQYMSAGRHFLSPTVSRMSRLQAGHPEGFFEAFGNYYQGFCREVLRCMGETDLPSIPHPTIVQGIESIRFVEACLHSHENGNVWVSL